MRSSRWGLGGLGLLAVAIAGCAEHVVQDAVDEPHAHPQDYILEPIGRSAVQADDLWNLVFWIAVGVFVLVMGILLAAVLRFRERPSDDGLAPKQIHGNPRLEAIWTVIPAVILAIIAVPTVRTIFDFAERPEDALTIQVTAHQFWWEFEYPDDAVVTANIAYIPTGTDVLLEMESGDVIHSFWIPKLAGKQDVVPGHTNYLRLYTEDEGEYLGQCAEFCGLSHANMRMRVIAVSPAEYETWLAEQAAPAVTAEPGTAAFRGQVLFGEFCVACHQVRGYELRTDDADVLAALEELGWSESRIERFVQDGRTITASARVGPDLTHFWDREWFAGAIFRTTEDNLAEWLDDPPRMKPMGLQMGAFMPDLGLEEGEIDDLVAYLRALGAE